MTYLGSILSPPKKLLGEIQGIINGFSLGKTRASKDRLYKKPSDGGLGLIDLEKFLSAQQAGWVVKAAQSPRDNWRVDLRNLSSGNLWAINNADVPCPAPNSFWLSDRVLQDNSSLLQEQE